MGIDFWWLNLNLLKIHLEIYLVFWKEFGINLKIDLGFSRNWFQFEIWMKFTWCLISWKINMEFDLVVFEINWKIELLLKVNIWNRFENRISVDIWKFKFTMEFIKEREICLKINIDLFLKCGNKFTDLERKFKVNR